MEETDGEEHAEQSENAWQDLTAEAAQGSITDTVVSHEEELEHDEGKQASQYGKRYSSLLCTL